MRSGTYHFYVRAEATELAGGTFEGTGECQAFLRQVQGGTQEGRRTRDMRKPQAQAEAGLKDSENSGHGSTAGIVFSVAVAWLGLSSLRGSGPKERPSRV